MSLKTVLFDMDGVIVDTEPLHRKAYNKLFEELNIEVSDAFYTSLLGSSTRNVCTKIIEKYQLNASFEDLAVVKRKYFKYFFDNDPDFKLHPNVKELIQHYHQNGIKLILASSASRNTINWVFERFELNPYFMEKVSGAELVNSKPDPDIFLKAAELSGELVENCMVIEDSTNGILAAHRANIFCAAYKNAHSKLQDYRLADIVVEDFRELEISKVSKYFG